MIILANIPLETLAISIGLPILVGLIILCLLLFRKLFLALSFACIYLAIIYSPFYIPVKNKLPDSIRIISTNVRIHKTNIQKQANYLQTLNADIITMVETNNSWQSHLPTLQKQLPHVITTKQGHRIGRIKYTDGFILLSRWPAKQLPFSDNQANLYKINAPQPFFIMLIHTLAPFHREMEKRRKDLFKTISKISLPQPLIIVGDYNAVPWDPPLYNMMKRQNLKYATHWLPTYRRKLPAVPIDHILYTPEFQPIHTQRLNVPTSDHFGQLVDFTFNNSH